MKKMKRILLLSLVLAALVACFTLHISAAEVVASGYCGCEIGGKNMIWQLDEEGCLTIFGNGSMQDYGGVYPPWDESGYTIKCVVIGDGVTSIGDEAFSYCEGLTAVTIPNSVTYIGEWAFSGCTDLTAVTLPNSVTYIGDYAFYDCAGLTTVTLPNSVTYIGDYAFYDCAGLTTVTIPDGVTSIGERAFSFCSGLTMVTIPDNVNSIGDSVFAYCVGLSSITVSSKNAAYYDVDGVLFGRGKTELVAYPAARTGSYVIPNGVTAIKENAFCCCAGLTTVTIPDGVTYIGDFVFNDCSGLTTVTIPDSVTYIGNGAFRACDSLISVVIPDGVTTIGDSAFSYCDSLISVIIPDSVTTIDYSAFNCCFSLKSVTIPDKVTSIRAHAFSYCTGLTAVYFEGNAPDVYSASDSGASFPENVTLYYTPGTTGWKDSDAYDAAAGTWHGYRLTTPESHIDPKPYLNKKAQKSVTLKGAKYFADKNNKAKKKTSSIDQELFVNSLTHVSLQNADDGTKAVVREQIRKLLYEATYRPTIFGGDEDVNKKWPIQNDDYGKEDKNGKKVYSVKDGGLGLRVKWSSYCAGCLSYGRFFSNYVYGCDGKISKIQPYVLKEGTKDNYLGSADEMIGKFRALLDPGETLHYKTKAKNKEGVRYQHALVFLGESEDGKGFYFASYNGGLTNGKELHGIYVGYYSYAKLYDVAYTLRLFNTNEGSYYKGTAKTVSLGKNGCGEIGTKTVKSVLKAQCPIEMVVKLDDEVLDSRLLANGQTGYASFGQMTALGDIGGDRSIEVQLNGPMEEYDYEVEIIGTGSGTMDLTILSTYTEDGEVTETMEQIFENVPIEKNAQIAPTGLSVQDTTELTAAYLQDGDAVITVWTTDGNGIGYEDEDANNFYPDPDLDMEASNPFFTAEAVATLEGNTIEAAFTFDGEGSDEYFALAVVCFYEKGKMLKAAVYEVDIVDSAASLTWTAADAYDKCKVFFVSEEETMQPISNVVEIG